MIVFTTKYLKGIILRTVSVKELKDIASIEEIISKYINLKKYGKIYKASCPFHNEKTPSFVVNPEKKFFHCFGCGESGDIFNFLIKYNNLSFREAVEEVANYYGLKLDNKFSPNKNINKDLKTKLIKLNAIALQEYRKLLKDSDSSNVVLDYLKSRNINMEMINLFSIGFAPDEWDSITNLFKKSNIPEPDIEKCDLILKSNKNDKLFDRFRNRIIFPIYNEKEDLIGFGGRTFGQGKTTGEHPAKYLNSSENEIFKKRNNLYNLNMAKNEILDTGVVLLTEGYIDVITCYQYGFRNVVAPLGTSLTIDQLKKLEKYAKKIIFIFDSDKAGINATFKSIDMAFQVNMEVFTITLPDGYDPHDFLIKFGKDEFNKLLTNAEDGLDYKLKMILQSFDINSTKGKENFIKSCFHFIRNTNNRIISEIALKKVSEITKINENTIRKTYSDRKYRNKTNRSINNTENFTQTETVEGKFQKIIITTLLASGDNVENFIPKLNDDLFSNEFYKKIFFLIKEIIVQNETLSINYVKEILNENEQEKFNSLIKDLQEYKIEPNKILNETINNLKLLVIEKRINDNNKKIKEAEQNNEITVLKEYLEEAQYLLLERKKLLDKKFNLYDKKKL